MKRFAIAATAVVVALAAAASAFAATTINTYKATYSFSGKKGTAKKPAALSFKQVIDVTADTAGDRTGILHKITTTVQGAKLDPTGFPTCTASKINAASGDSSCPKKALVASGSIQASLGPANPFTTATGQPCDPLLHVWNGGKGKLIFFFVDSTPHHECLGGAIQTGAVPPWTASYKQAGKNLDVTIPIPNTVDYPAGKAADEIGSLSSETLNWKSQTDKGHTDLVSTGCSRKRKYSFSFKASLPTSATQTNTVKGTAACG